MTHLIISDDDLRDSLTAYAFANSDAFCYGCYKVVKPNQEGHCICPTCLSDDLMRHLHGIGVEYGITWVMGAFIKEKCKPIDIDEHYHTWLSDLYPEEVTICEVTFDQASALKKLDPIAYEIGQSDMIHHFLDDESWIELEGEYYDARDIWEFLD